MVPIPPGYHPAAAAAGTPVERPATSAVPTVTPCLGRGVTSIRQKADRDFAMHALGQ